MDWPRFADPAVGPGWPAFPITTCRLHSAAHRSGTLSAPRSNGRRHSVAGCLDETLRPRRPARVSVLPLPRLSPTVHPVV